MHWILTTKQKGVVVQRSTAVTYAYILTKVVGNFSTSRAIILQQDKRTRPNSEQITRLLVDENPAEVHMVIDNKLR